MDTTIANITLGSGGEAANIWLAVGTAAAANIVALVVVALQARSSFSLLKAQRKIDVHERRLTEFYGPLLSLLKANGEIFSRAGPPAFPKEEGAKRRAAASSWKIAKNKVLNNNLAIENVILTKGHHLAPRDDMASYMELLVHVQMYQAFQERETDWYLANFRFPSGIVEHVAKWHDSENAAYQKALGGGKKFLRKQLLANPTDRGKG
jgi:hypothetical protein